ncbi:MAG TPA: hypothetical protein VK356_10195 [Thermomicrobiales bacterium]|nr:hypothetical protein [Thermomicrobiales bacterium]
MLRQVEGADDEPRSVMLGTIRGFSLNQLHRRREEEAVIRGAHATFSPIRPLPLELGSKPEYP